MSFESEQRGQAHPPPRLHLEEFRPEREIPTVNEFIERLYARTPRAFVTPVLVLANVVVYVVMVAFGVHWMSPSTQELRAWGADFGPLTTNGDWWRLLTATFLHAGALHLAFNMFALTQGGLILERLLGNFSFAAVYLFCGVFASLTSVYWHPLATSVGASGAVFGVFGAILGYYLRARSVIPPKLFKHLMVGLLPFLGYNLLFGQVVANVDQSAHLGGLIAGTCFGLLLGHPRAVLDDRNRRRRTLATLTLASCILVGWVLTMRGWIQDPQVELRHLAETQAAVLQRYQLATLDRLRNKLDDGKFAEVIETEVIPPWRDAEERMAGLRHLPADTLEHFQSILLSMRLRREAWELVVQALREKDEDKAKLAREKFKEADAATRGSNAEAHGGNNR